MSFLAQALISGPRTAILNTAPNNTTNFASLTPASNHAQNQYPCHTRWHVSDGLLRRITSSITVNKAARSFISSYHTPFSPHVTRSITTVLLDSTIAHTETQNQTFATYLQQNKDTFLNHPISDKAISIIADIHKKSYSAGGFNTFLTDVSRTHESSSFSINGCNAKTAAAILATLPSEPESDAIDYRWDLFHAFCAGGFDAFKTALMTRHKQLDASDHDAFLQSIIDGSHAALKSSPPNPINIGSALSYAETTHKRIHEEKRYVKRDERFHLMSLCDQYADSHSEKADAFRAIKSSLQTSLTTGDRDTIDDAFCRFDTLEKSLEPATLEATLTEDVALISGKMPLLEMLKKINRQLTALKENQKRLDLIDPLNQLKSDIEEASRNRLLDTHQIKAFEQRLKGIRHSATQSLPPKEETRIEETASQNRPLYIALASISLTAGAAGSPLVAVLLPPLFANGVATSIYMGAAVIAIAAVAVALLFGVLAGTSKPSPITHSAMRPHPSAGNHVGGPHTPQ